LFRGDADNTEARRRAVVGGDWGARRDVPASLAKGERVRNLIKAQLQAYDYIIDLATDKSPVSEMWIRTYKR
jgi:hypothetical protein